MIAPMTKIIFYAEKGDREKIYEMYSDYSKGIPRLSKNIPGEIDDIIDAFSEGITKDGRKNLAYNSDWGGERGGRKGAHRLQRMGIKNSKLRSDPWQHYWKS